MSIKFDIDPHKQFFKALKKAQQEVADLTEPLKEISDSWFKSNQAIFALKGPGKYVDLAPSTKKQKAKTGSVYPILERSGKLKQSITNPSDSHAVSDISNKNSLTVGTRVTSKGSPYAIFIHHGTKKMPARPVVLFGAEQVAPTVLNKRVSLWERMLTDYVKQVSGGFAS